MRLKGDIDIDLSSRESILEHLEYTSAAMRNVVPMKKHPSGVYVTEIPYDPIHDMAALDYTVAEERGYFKLDLLNVFVYSFIRDNDHLAELMSTTPNWSNLSQYSYVNKIVHINNHYRALKNLPEPIDSIEKMAMFLAAIRPAKRYLLDSPWEEIEKEIWTKTDEYSFKKSHAIGYGTLVAVHMNLIDSGINAVID